LVADKGDVDPSIRAALGRRGIAAVIRTCGDQRRRPGFDWQAIASAIGSDAAWAGWSNFGPIATRYEQLAANTWPWSPWRPAWSGYDQFFGHTLAVPWALA
jgi:hypothetical protein